MLHIVYNPVSGGGKCAQALREVESLLRERGTAYLTHPTRNRNDCTSIVRGITAEDDPDQKIVVMGGDGTLNEALNGIADPARVRLGLIPCGSGNDFAAAAGIPDDPRAAIELILDGEARYTDYMECSGVRGINAIGTGIDVDILRRYSRMKLLRGSAAYFASLVLTLFSYKAYRFEETTDGASHPHSAFIACAGNGSSIGGGIPICPEAVLDDGLLDVVIVDDIRPIAIPRALITLMRRRILGYRTTTFKRQERLRIQSGAPTPIQIDGEIYEDLPFDVRLVHGVLRFYRP